MIKVKVCGMRKPDNISRLIKLDLDFIGFIFYPKSPRFVDMSQMIDILRLVPSTINKVGVFVDEKIETVLEIVESLKLDYVQLHGKESPEYCKKCKNYPVKVIKSFSVDDKFNFRAAFNYYEASDFFLFDTKSPKHGGTGIKFDWKILKNYKSDKPFFLSGGIAAEDADTIRSLKLPQLYAVDINSKFEVEPALKDIELIDRFIGQIKR